MNIPSFIVKKQHVLKRNIQLAGQRFEVLVLRGGVNLAGMRVISQALPLVINLEHLDNFIGPRGLFGPRGKSHAQVGFEERLEQGAGVFKGFDFPFLPDGVWLVWGWEEGREGGDGGL